MNALGVLVGALFLGASGWNGALGPLAWMGVALLGWACARSGTRWETAGLVALHQAVTKALWFHWGGATAQAMAPDEPSLVPLVAVGLVVVTAVPVLLGLVLGALAFGRFAVSLWIPLAWMAGERVQAQWTSVASDWLFTQVDCAPLMDALATLGLEATTLVALFIAVTAGQAAATRSGLRGLLACAAAAGLLLFPTRAAGHAELLEKVGAVHLTRDTDVPDVPSVTGDLELLVWPESFMATRPPVVEGDPHKERLPFALGGPRTWHLAGATTLRVQGRQNSVLSVSPDGAITGVRSKSVLLPVFERRFLGWGLSEGKDAFVPGRAAPMLDVNGVKVIPIICGELLSRSPFIEGTRAGGQLVAVLASDTYMAQREVTRLQVMAHVRLRAIEFHLPVAYASSKGQASLVAADGSVLAESAPGAPSGVLTWSHTQGSADRLPPHNARVAVVHSRSAPWLRPDCPPGRCAVFTVEDFQCPTARFPTVIIAGHSAPPLYLGISAAELTRIIACFRPELTVFDTCFGASSPMLQALADTVETQLVAAPFLVHGRGFRYAPDFFLTDKPLATHVTATPDKPLLSVRTSPALRVQLDQAVEQVQKWGGATLKAQLESWNPTLVRAALPDGQTVLVPADWKRVEGRTPR